MTSSLESNTGNKLPPPVPKSGTSASITLASTMNPTHAMNMPSIINHGLFAVPTPLSSSSNRTTGGLMSSMSFSAASMDLMDNMTPSLVRKSIPIDFFQPSPSLDEGITGLNSFSRDWAMIQSRDFRSDSTMRSAESLRSDSIAQLEMILTPRPAGGMMSVSSHSSNNLQTSSLDSIGSNFFQNNLANNDGFPSIELSVPSMDSMDSLFQPSDQSSVTTPSNSSKGRARLKWTTEMVSSYSTPSFSYLSFSS